MFFDQQIGRLLRAAPSLPFEDEVQLLLDTIVENAKTILKVKKVRIFGVDYNSLGQPKELWVVAGETGNLGKSISLGEWAGLTLKVRSSLRPCACVAAWRRCGTAAATPMATPRVRCGGGGGGDSSACVCLVCQRRRYLVCRVLRARSDQL